MTIIAATSGKCYFNEAEYRDGLKVEFIVNTKKVYVVEATSGEYEEYRKWIHAIYLTWEDAVKSRDELKEKMKLLREIPCPVDATFLEDLSEKDYELYRGWEHAQSEAERFNNALVAEYEIGVIYE